jgi:membrane protein YqaA with SNARE-associated domain
MTGNHPATPEGGGARPPGRVVAHKWGIIVGAHVAAAFVWLLGNLVLRWAAPDVVRPWDLGWAVWGAAFSAAVILPTFFEPALLLATTAAENVLAILAASLGVTMGSGIVYLLGDTARARFERMRARWRWLDRSLEWTEHLSRPWAYLALGALLAIPGLVDSLALYIASLLGLRMWPFLATVFVATAVRSTLVVLAGEGLGF